MALVPTFRPKPALWAFDIAPGLAPAGRMLLAVDAGNSSVSFAVFDERSLRARFFAPYAVAPVTAGSVENALGGHGLSPADITAVGLASVGPHLAHLEHELGQLAPVFTLRVDPNFGMPIAYPNPNELGVDRWLNALAAFEQHRGAVVVVDIGTATNFECVSATGTFLGGAICIGPQTSLDALSARSSKLAHLTLEPPSNVLANTTRDALLSGAYQGHAAMIDGMVAQLKASLSTPVTVVGTGGFVSRFAPVCRSLDVINPDLTLQGVQLVYERSHRAGS